MWNSLQNLLPKAAGSYNMTTTLKAINICREFRSLAKKHLPPNAETETTPSYKEDTATLTIGVKTPAWAQELNIKRHLILAELHQKFDPRAIKEIRIRHIAPPPVETVGDPEPVEGPISS